MEKTTSQEHEHVYRCQDCGEIQDITALLDEARLRELNQIMEILVYQGSEVATAWDEAAEHAASRISTLTQKQEN